MKIDSFVIFTQNKEEGTIEINVNKYPVYLCFYFIKTSYQRLKQQQIFFTDDSTFYFIIFLFVCKKNGKINLLFLPVSRFQLKGTDNSLLFQALLLKIHFEIGLIATLSYFYIVSLSLSRSYFVSFLQSLYQSFFYPSFKKIVVYLSFFYSFT